MPPHGVLADYVPFYFTPLARDFRRDPEDPEKIERYQAEALVHVHLPAKALLGIICYTEAVAEGLRRQAHDMDLNLKIVTRPGWYFR